MPLAPEPLVDDIAANLAAVKAAIAAAAGAAGRSPEEVTLVAVAKSHPPEAARAALVAGHRVFGENRVQEADGKWPMLRADFPDVRLHLIGPLQRNKIKRALHLFDVIETVDRRELAVALAEAMAREDRRPDVLVQVNVAEEPQKHGVAPAEADDFIEFCRSGLRLPVRGLMCIPPLDDDPSPHFMRLRAMAQRYGLPDLSMGMSADFAAAIACGATMVRVGTAIFGVRPPPPA
jgi:hypothetical protein